MVLDKNNTRATRKGKLKAEVVQADGSKTTKILSPVKYSPKINRKFAISHGGNDNRRQIVKYYKR